MQRLILDTIKDTNLYSFLLVFLGGIVLSFSSCVLIRIPLVMSFIAGGSVTKKRSLQVLLAFIIGLILGYTGYGVLLGYGASLVMRHFTVTNIVFFAIGMGLLIMSLHLLGFIHIPQVKITSEALSKFVINANIFGAFIFGMLFVFFEAPGCPSCGPVIFAIAALTIAKGKLIYGAGLFFTYALGQSIPLLIAGIFSGTLKSVKARMEHWQELIQIISAVILLYLGVYFIWLA